MFEIECKIGDKKEIMFCVFGQKGKSGGGTLFGVGGQYGEEKPTFECFCEDEINDKIASKLGIKKEKIIWEEKNDLYFNNTRQRFVASLLALTSFGSYNSGYTARSSRPNSTKGETSYSQKTLSEIRRLGL